MTDMHEASIAACETWETDGITYRELCRQDYANILFSAGTREGPTRPEHEKNTVFLRWDHLTPDGKEVGDGGMLELTRDELAAIAWVCSGVLWSTLIGEVEDNHVETLAQIDATTDACDAGDAGR